MSWNDGHFHAACSQLPFSPDLVRVVRGIACDFGDSQRRRTLVLCGLVEKDRKTNGLLRQPDSTQPPLAHKSTAPKLKLPIYNRSAPGPFLVVACVTVPICTSSRACRLAPCGRRRAGSWVAPSPASDKFRSIVWEQSISMGCKNRNPTNKTRSPQASRCSTPDICQMLRPPPYPGAARPGPAPGGAVGAGRRKVQIMTMQTGSSTTLTQIPLA